MLRAAAAIGALVTFLTAADVTGGMMGAPAPLPKPRPPMQVTAGSHVLVWGGMRFQMHLGAQHHYAAKDGPHGDRWLGSWNWCPDKRVLVISETLAGWDADSPPPDAPPSSYTTYTIRLDAHLRGHTQAPGPQIEVRVEPLVIKARKGR